MDVGQTSSFVRIEKLIETVGMTPEDIPLGYYTHINFAFALVNPTTFHIEDMGPDTAALYDRVSALKSKDPDLKVWIGKCSGSWKL